MNRKRLLLISMAALVAAAFVVDRIWFSEPAKAEAQTTEAGGKARGNAPRRLRPAAARAAVATAEKTVALEDPSLEPLGKLYDSGASRDVFTPSPGMLQSLLQSEDATEKAAKPGSPQAFAAEHQLQGTSTGAGGPLAVVNGKPLRIGDQLAGFRLGRIAPYAAEFTRAGERVILTMPQNGTAEKAAPAQAPAAN